MEIHYFLTQGDSPSLAQKVVDGTSTPVRSDAAQSLVRTEQNCDELLLTSLCTPQKSGTVIVTVVAPFLVDVIPLLDTGQ